jgi:hypothetical protein
MKIAVLVISLGLFLIVGFQCCVAMTGGSFFGEKGSEQAGSMGIFLSLMFLVAAGFSLKVPLVSSVVLFIGGILALLTGGEHYGDLPVWGGVAIILGIISLVAHKRKKITKGQNQQNKEESFK